VALPFANFFEWTPAIVPIRFIRNIMRASFFKSPSIDDIAPSAIAIGRLANGYVRIEQDFSDLHQNSCFWRISADPSASISEHLSPTNPRRSKFGKAPTTPSVPSAALFAELQSLLPVVALTICFPIRP